MAAQNWLRAAIVSSVCLGLASADDCSGTTTISSNADATSLAEACKTYSGIVAVATGASGDLSLEVERSSYAIGNTGISSLDGGASDAVLEDINVYSNKDLEDITIDCTHADNITIGANSDKADISFPNLKEAVDIEIANASAIDLSALESLPRGALHIYGGSLEKLDLAAFTEVSDGLILEDLPKLTQLSAPEFTRIMDRGALTISNTGLTELSLPKLQLIYSSLWLEGDFESVDLPLLTSVGGDIYMKGAKSFDCDAFSEQFSKLATGEQTFKCVAGDDSDESDSEASKPTASSSFNSASSTKTAASSKSAAATSGAASSGAASSGAASSAAASSAAATPTNASSAASSFGVGMATLGGVVGLVSFFL
ncbi:gpi-anchored cell wall organization protein ecm33 [Diplodia corticola]|uniref:Gpi-anchored cell wall organization protein ecm33 n=1 Tax=Diplodia corticola TaxID=236234 RepID=A0A1J9RPY7_9PEZI|nr:gpi-anchored cell wall organization protein ecm33 [Diplodia corticola]OJD29621.1 gpi-anchored cell wall organization protein ecm33 [Diplodia corticola]